MKKIIAACLAGALFLFGLSAQEDFSDLDAMFNQDLSAQQSANSDGDGSGAAQGGQPLKMGMWIRVYGDSKFITRDKKNGTEKGYEFDKLSLVSKANWWFYGDLGKFHLDAEVGVWKFDNTMYQANSYAGNIPTVTWGDGAQNLISRFWAPVSGMNDNTAGMFNKLGFKIQNPWVNTFIGYGELKDNTLTNWTGIYKTIYNYRDVGKGGIELSNGSRWSDFGDVKLKTMVGLSRSRAQYGSYSLVSVDLFDKANVSATFGSTTNKAELFRYDEQNTNAASLYASYNFTDAAKAEAHGMYTWGTDISGWFGQQAAGAIKLSYTTEKFSARASQSYAGSKAATVWGIDETVGLDSLYTLAGASYKITDAFSLGMDYDMKFSDTENLADGHKNFRFMPMFDVEMEPLLSIPLSIKTYAAANLDIIEASVNSSKPSTFTFDEAGIEIAYEPKFAFLQKLVFDYAAKASYDSLSSGDSSYTHDIFYNTIMLEAQITERLGANFGALIKSKNGADDGSFVPVGLAFGVNYQTKWEKIKHPRVYAQFLYGMDPYEDYDYELFRADSYKNAYVPHRTFLPNTWSDSANQFLAESHVRLGIIWDF